ncbi:hypothetical protein SAMN05660742_114106 [Propionispira arboris]|uniref:Helicase ATP-binding domain-containing protein n=1 Tax=Propionispira arboris TaxID=84035 RepID=A0A1H7B1T5_9FIRM|nr:hypothetical protein [Propionispira arboris]SEJ71438.1 hypothetical protein SAMN05660742_114106 [Propionispira arboris]
MYKFNSARVCWDRKYQEAKPTGEVAAIISKRIGYSTMKLTLSNIENFVYRVGSLGHTFCPATFKDGKRSKENFEQQQLIALDFDNKDSNNCISFKEIKSRAEDYELPILFAYDTLSSKNHNKFRVVFLNDVSITDRKVAEATQLAIGTMFPEADTSCYKDVSKMYYGGKQILYYDKKTPEINVESVFRNLCYYLKDKYKANHYKGKITNFSKTTGIALNKNGLLDVMVMGNPTEYPCATILDEKGKNSPSSIIYSKNLSSIKAVGENFPEKYYRINFSTNDSSVGKNNNSRSSINHKSYRSADIKDINQKCELFKEFESGKRRLHHKELYGILTNLLQVETGSQRFVSILSKNPAFYSDNKEIWEGRHIPYMKQHDYRSQNCNDFCPYQSKCNHGTSILSTVCPKRGMIEKTPGYSEIFHPLEEVQKDTYNAISKAYCANNKQFQIVKAMTAVGKTTSYLKLMSENPTDRFLIAAPTNLLKDEIYNKAVRMNIAVSKTPSLEQIKNEIPSKIWNRIQRMYSSGLHCSVHPYINEILKKKDIPCLREYLKAREELKTFDGSIITTHRYLLNMDEKRLREYDAIIIDEDIIFKSVISNQGEITVSNLKELLEKTTDNRLFNKITELLKHAKIQSCIEVDSFELDDVDDGDNDKSILFDIPSFCLAERFYLRKASKEEKLKEDTVAFLKPVTFKNVKYIMVSATVNEDICRNFFGKDNVSFYDCKRAEYKGELYQYPRKSMSRTCVANNVGIMQRLMKRFAIDEDKVITFMKQNIGYLHFGNTEGSNALEGEDILVVGTPYHAEFLYKLVAFTMGIDFDEKEEMTAQFVTHNGYRFWFTTFKDENMRAINFWMIESELEQAVGRARLLRNKCKVKLFSNFPLCQAKMICDFDYEKD